MRSAAMSGFGDIGTTMTLFFDPLPLPLALDETILPPPATPRPKRDDKEKAGDDDTVGVKGEDTAAEYLTFGDGAVSHPE